MSGRPASLATPALRAVAAAAVTVLAVGGGFRVFSHDSTPSATVQPRASGTAAVPVAEDAPGVTTSEPQIRLEGEALVLAVPVHNGESDPLVITGVDGLPSGMLARPGAGGLRVPAHGDATLPIAWSGPDCAGALPDVLVGDLTWTGRLGTLSRGGMPGSPIDAVARTVWLDTCAGRPSEGGLPRNDEG